MGRRLLLILGMILLASAAHPGCAVRARVKTFRGRAPKLPLRPFRLWKSRAKFCPATMGTAG